MRKKDDREAEWESRRGTWVSNPVSANGFTTETYAILEMLPTGLCSRPRPMLSCEICAAWATTWTVVAGMKLEVCGDCLRDIGDRTESPR